MQNFRTYRLAETLYRQVCGIVWPSNEFREISGRACHSIVLNISAGYGKRTRADRRICDSHAIGSLREPDGCADLIDDSKNVELADKFAPPSLPLIKNTGLLP